MAPEETREELLEFRHVGEATADVLADAGIDASDLSSKSVSHSQLVAAGVNPGVAARIRREHSLQWSFEGGEDLDQRAEQVRGLQDDERQWVAASYGDEASADGGADAAAGESSWRRQSPASVDEDSAMGDQSWPNGSDSDAGGDGPDADSDGPDAERDEAAWREQSSPTSVTELYGVGEVTEEKLAEAGITSVRSLASASPEEVAESLALSSDRVAELKSKAEEYDE